MLALSLREVLLIKLINVRARCVSGDSATFSTSCGDRLEQLWWRWSPTGRSVLTPRPRLTCVALQSQWGVQGSGENTWNAVGGGVLQWWELKGEGMAGRGRFHVGLLQLLLGRAPPQLSLTQGHHAAATRRGRGCLCSSSWVRRCVCVCPAPIRHFLKVRDATRTGSRWQRCNIRY